MEQEDAKRDAVLKRVREELGAIRSCALMIAHAQAADTRTRYLKTLNERAAAIESLLAKLSPDSSQAR